MNSVETPKLLPDPDKKEPWRDEISQVYFSAMIHLGDARDRMTALDWMIVGAKWMENRTKEVQK